MTSSLRAGVVGGLLISSIPFIAFGAEFRTGDQPSLSLGQTVNNDLYMAGGSVTVSGAVNGDLVVSGGNLLINGPVSADVLAAGGTITILGDIGGDVRALGGNVLLQSAVLGDVIAGGGQVHIGGPKIGGDVAALGGVVTIDAPISGTLHAAGGQITINAPVGGNVIVQAENVTLGPKANLAGTFTYTATEKVTIEDGAVVQGVTKYTSRTDVREAAKVGIGALLSLWIVSKFFMLLIGSFIISLVLNRYSHELVRKAAEKPWLEIGRGAIFLIVTPIASLILLATIVGIPFGAMGLFAYALLLIFVCLAAPIVVGSITHKLIFKPATYEITWKTILIGTVICYVLAFIPFIGWIVQLGITLIVLGSALNVKWNAIKAWR